MRPQSRIASFAWAGVLVAALLFVGWCDLQRARRIEHLSALAGSPLRPDRLSPTGYADGVRNLIVPERNLGSYQWIAQTQQMRARGEWRIRHVDYDNTPYGRDTRNASPYRGWLGGLAAIDQMMTGRSTGAAVEHAALYSDVVLHGLLLLSATLFVAWQFGGWPAAFVAAGLAVMFPLAGGFLPGQPDDHGLVLGAELWSLLFLLAGYRRDRGTGWFVLAGVAGALALWIDASEAVPFILAIPAGGLAAAACRLTPAGAMRPWRMWGLGGAATVLLLYLIDSHPGVFEGDSLNAVHPLYGLAWLGVSEWLAWAEARTAGRPAVRRAAWRLTLASIAIALVPVAMAGLQSRGFLTAPLLDWRMSGLAGGPVAANAFEMTAQENGGRALLLALLPLVVVIPAARLLARRSEPDPRRAVVAVALGPVAVALGLALFHLRWWAALDVTLLGLVVALAPSSGRRMSWGARAGWIGGALAIVVLGAGRMAPRSATDDAVSASEMEALIERDLAHWLRARTGADAPALLAPPDLAAALSYYGGARALSTPYPENMDGFAAAVRIASTALPDEAYALVRRRQLTHIVVPSWDTHLDEYARLGGSAEKSFISLLHQWLPPRWLRPIPYQMPAVPGLEGRSVVVFEVVELQDDATGLAHLAEYFVEMGDLDSAAQLADALANWYPEDAGALISRALVERARGNTVRFDRCLAGLDQALAKGADPLGWERRVLLSLVFAEARRFDAARMQLQRCLGEADEPRLRSLTTGTLYRMQALGRVLGVEWPDAALREFALGLVPADARERLQAIPAAGSR